MILSIILSVLLSFAILHPSAYAADKPSDLIVGKWCDRAEPDDAVIEFVKDGSGTITEKSSDPISQANISWKIMQSFGNACVLFIEYEDPKPEGIKPFTWLIAFDGKNTFISQPVQDKIVFMDRQQ